MPRAEPGSAKTTRAAACLLVLGLLAVLLAGLKPLSRDLAYRPLLLGLLEAVCLYQLALRPTAASLAALLLALAPGLFVFIHYYGALAVIPALAQAAKFLLAAWLYRALYTLLDLALPPRSRRPVRLLAALALPLLTVTFPAGASLLLLLALTPAVAGLAVYLERAGRHD